MTGIALGIVLAAAFLHSTWNYLLKKSQRKIAFIWWFLLVSTVLFIPMFLFFWPKVTISKAGWICVVTTGILHALYCWFIGGAYERGDLSLVYPLARGSGLLFVPFLAVAFLHEQLSFLGIIGIILIIFGIYVIHLRSFSGQSFIEPFLALREGASIWALCTGGTIAGYSLVDKIGVSIVLPTVYIYLMLVITWVLLTPYVFAKERKWLNKEWHLNKGTIIIVGFLSPFTYLMILFAFKISKVSYVVAVREVSIVFSVFYGILRLKEKHGNQKIVGAVLISLGVIFIALTR